MEDLGKLLSSTSTFSCLGSTFHPSQNCRSFPSRFGDAAPAKESQDDLSLKTKYDEAQCLQLNKQDN